MEFASHVDLLFITCKMISFDETEWGIDLMKMSNECYGFSRI